MEKPNNLAVPRVEHDHELLLQAWECAFAGARVRYLSGPITTGPRFVNWYKSVGKALERDGAQYSVSLREAVMRPRPYPCASGSTKCGSCESAFMIEQITNIAALGGRDDRLSPLLDRVPTALWR